IRTSGCLSHALVVSMRSHTLKTSAAGSLFLSIVRRMFDKHHDDALIRAMHWNQLDTSKQDEHPSHAKSVLLLILFVPMSLVVLRAVASTKT
ncbi:MAG: hypothetical protein IJ708_13205, partial [Clostridia bacterium]|nr:hypothetical protein [Clostridia bacterium]